MTHSGPEVQVRTGRTGEVTVLLAGAGRYTDGTDQTAPSHDSATPEPVVVAVPPPSVPPPAATQKVSEMHESEENPPAGGSAVSDAVQPGAGTTGAGTEVGASDGSVVVVVVVVVGTVRCAWTVDRWDVVGVADEDAVHAHPTIMRVTRQRDAPIRFGSTSSLTSVRPVRPQ
jgi:hypothetical protein